MSGIVGIVNLGGAPVDRRLLGRMTKFMTFRGPDAQHLWLNGHVGFGHTLLRTTFEAEHEHQPFTLDGETYIVADARVDAQDELISKVSAHGEHVKRGVPDVELLLRAYRVWGEDCVEHLLGDFAFAVWDARLQRLFCARDHLGVKPFFYAHLGKTLIFSNTLDCVRQHPAVSAALNDLAIADFLVFDLNQDPKTTTFRHIQRLPPAHRATCSATGLLINRYWTIPIDEPSYSGRADDCVEQFKQLLFVVVQDRLRVGRAGIFMSGGLDSTLLAATAWRVRQWSARFELRAFTTVIDGILDKDEAYYAGLTAAHLGIPILYQPLLELGTHSEWDRTSIHTPEPTPGVMTLFADKGRFESVASYNRVCFYGEGPDNALQYEWRPYLRYLIRKRRFGRLAQDMFLHTIKHRRVPLLPSVPRMIKQWLHGRDWAPKYPGWLDKNFESRLELRARWEEHHGQLSGAALHPVRPAAHGSFQGLLWESLFRDFDAEQKKIALEFRYPFLDLRMLRYLLAIPTIPWCRTKYLLRCAGKGLLPDAILRRPKVPLAGDPPWEWARRKGLPRINPAPALHRYVDVRLVPNSAGDDMVGFRTDFRARELNYWLQNIEPHA